MGGPVKSKPFKWLLDWIYDEKAVVEQAALDQELAAQQARMNRASAMMNQYSNAMTNTALNQYTNAYRAYQGQQVYGNLNSGALGTSISLGGYQELATAENKVKSKVKEALIDLEVYFFMPATGGYGNSGVPDFVACVEGRFFGIECKAGRNKTTALQDKHLNAITNAKGASLVIDETNMDNVKALILAKLGELQ